MECNPTPLQILELGLIPFRDDLELKERDLIAERAKLIQHKEGTDERSICERLAKIEEELKNSAGIWECHPM